MRVTGVTSSNAGFSVAPFPTVLCSILGFPASLCPSSNGFYTTINSGSTKEVCILVQRSATASGGTTLTFNGDTVSGSCGGASTCSAYVNIGTGEPFFCEIDPASLSYATNEVARFLVQCKNIAGTTIPCKGENWYFADGVSGLFWDKDNTKALAYPTSSPGSTGTLNYESGHARCWSDITVVKPSDSQGNYQCEFIPSSADMESGDVQYFQLNCFHDGVSSKPDDADYDRTGGLDGTLSDESTSGVNFTAGSDSSGHVRGFAQWNIPGDDPILGVIATAEVKIGGGGITNITNDTNVTNGNGDDDDHDDTGSSEHCKIDSGPITVYPGYSGWADIMCGADRNISCTLVMWDPDPPASVSLTDPTKDGISFTITGDPGDSGKIWAEVVYDGGVGDCFLPFIIETPECWEFS
jgi:hypothetical protein